MFRREATGRRRPTDPESSVSFPPSLAFLLACDIYIYGITGYRNYILTDRSSSPEKSWRGRARRSLEVLSDQREKNKTNYLTKNKKGEQINQKKNIISPKNVSPDCTCAFYLNQNPFCSKKDSVNK